MGTEYLAPRNPIERAVADVWQKLFGIDKVGIRDDFFALGGDSLLAVQVLAKLRDIFKVDLPSHSLLGAPTIAALSELIARADSPSSVSFSLRKPTRALPPTLVPIKQGVERPLFLVHPVGGHVYFYRDLAFCLEAAQPVYGLQAQGVDGNAPFLTRIEDMATRYIEAVRVVQPEGPYLLGGASFGGLVAYEMAQRLLQNNERVDLLTMMDTPSPKDSRVTENATRLNRLVYLITGDPNVPEVTAELEDLSPEEQLLRMLEKAGPDTRMLPKLTTPQLARFRKLVMINMQAVLRYTPRPYPGKVLFFRARERDAFTTWDPIEGWLGLVQGGLDICEVPGNHITMSFPPNANVIATRLGEALGAVRATG